LLIWQYWRLEGGLYDAAASQKKKVVVGGWEVVKYISEMN